MFYKLGCLHSPFAQFEFVPPGASHARTGAGDVHHRVDRHQPHPHQLHQEFERSQEGGQAGKGQDRSDLPCQERGWNLV